MLLVVGLGNPGAGYVRTRHNAGYWIADILAERWGLAFSKKKFEGRFAAGSFAGRSVVLLKPETYMNLSGRSVGAAANFYGADAGDLLVIHDDVDLPPGRIKLKRGGGSGGHKGIDSIAQAVGPDFFRLRFGVGRPENPAEDTADFVLSRVAEKDALLFRKRALVAADAVECFLTDGLVAAQSRFHGEGENSPREDEK